MRTFRIIEGDALKVAQSLPSESVQTVVTSPPYFRMRDYGVDGQIGLEETPEAYVSRLVEVFREVKRVLRNDGTLFLNLGDSYFGSTQTGGTNGKEGSAKRKGRMFSRAGHAQACGSADREVSNYLDCGSSSQSPYGGHTGSSCSGTSGICLRHAATQVRASCSRIRACTAELLDHLPTEDSSRPQLIRQSFVATLDSLQTEARALAHLLASLESMTGESSPLLRGEGMQAEPASAFLSSLRSLTVYVPAFVRRSDAALEKSDCTADIASLSEELDSRIRCTDEYCSLLFSYLTIRQIEPQRSILKPKDLIGIPWMVAFALRTDGWYLRSDIIWHKPNPMPESVTDRPTKAHEYLFLLTKSAAYYYDAGAIAEDAASSTQARAYLGKRPVSERHELMQAVGMHGKSDSLRIYDRETRNRRSVWTVATQPFSEAHFAVFPPELITPCILAGSREGDTVYDPFTGSGTTGLVALRHGRDFIGSELNPRYVEMARQRIAGDAPLLNREVAA